MSFEITTSFVEQYGANIHVLSQQRGSRLLRGSRVESVRGKNAFFERIGATAAQQRTTRHGDTPLMNTPHSRRRVSLTDYDWADLVDDLDKVRTLIDPTNAYVQAGGLSMGRTIDDVIITALLGTAFSGVDGSTAVTLPASQKIASSAVGMNVDKMRKAKEKLDAAEVDEMIPRYMVMSARQLRDLLAETETTSSDFATVKALVHGELDEFLGFTILRSERLTLNGSSERQVIAWAEQGILTGIGANPVARISERGDKNYSTQVYYSMAVGAVRMEEVMVVEIACTES